MWDKKSGLLPGKQLKVLHYFPAHGDKGIYGFHEIPCKRHVAGPFFMWYHIIDDADGSW